MSMKNLRIEERALEVGQYFVDHDTTVRATAKYFGTSKTCVHADLTKVLAMLDQNLYEKAKEKLEKNKKDSSRRGGEALKQKYLRRK